MSRVEESGATAGRKWFLAVMLACPPCLAAGIAATGAGLGAALLLKGLLILAGLVAIVTFAAVWWTRRRRAACAIEA